jgi:hypothetical protein
MIDRISFGQMVIAAIYASPFMALSLVAAGNNWLFGVNFSRLIGPLIVCALMLWIPTIISNVIARSIVGWWGSALSGAEFHIAVALVAGGLLVCIVDLASRGTVQIGGGPLGWPMLFALVLAAACNGGMIWAVLHFGWKSAYD